MAYMAMLVRYDTKNTCNRRKKIDKLDFTKIKNHCASTDAIKEMRTGKYSYIPHIAPP